MNVLTDQYGNKQSKPLTLLTCQSKEKIEKFKEHIIAIQCFVRLAVIPVDGFVAKLIRLLMVSIVFC